MTIHYFPGAWARNILISCELLDYSEPIVFTNNLKSSRKEKYHWKSSGTTISDFRVFPNPARDFVIIEHQNYALSEQTLIDFIDIHGKCVKSVALASGKHQYIIPIGDILSGSYIIQIRSDGIISRHTKLIIIR
ncbi:MAG: T9SS type A sorting domain-containing protein [Alphaproteobacteria bacterium]|nr:T9SS type A sorting domain-containing protein [Alphaproteobacteria bacterium]